MPMSDDDVPRTGMPADALFLALQPDAGTAGRIAALAARLRTQHGLTGTPQPAGLLHVTLFFMGRFAGVPQELVARCCEALAHFRAPSFDVCFDRVLSFGGKSRRPVVLVGGALLAPLHQFQGHMRSVLLQANLSQPDKPAFIPHVTLLRDDLQVPEQPVEPVCWTVRDFVLVRSLHGRGEHQVLARFALDARLPPGDRMSSA